jgi:hypothetical protein
MTRKILGSHVQRLLSGVSVHGRPHLTGWKPICSRPNCSKKPSGKLTGSFVAVHLLYRQRAPGSDQPRAG